MDTLNVYGDGPHTHPKHAFRIAPHFRYFLGGLIFPFWRCMGKCMGNRWPILGDLALFFRLIRYNLRIVIDIAIVGPRKSVTWTHKTSDNHDRGG